MKKKVDSLLQTPILQNQVYSFIMKLQVYGDPGIKKFIQRLGLLYFMLMDLYLEDIYYFILDTFNNDNAGVGHHCFWGRKEERGASLRA